jgi:hypothetical protein
MSFVEFAKFKRGERLDINARRWERMATDLIFPRHIPCFLPFAYGWETVNSAIEETWEREYGNANI